MENESKNKFENEIVNIECTDNYIRVTAKEKIKFKEDLINSSLEHLDYTLENYYQIFSRDNSKTIEIHFNLSNISAVETYKFSKRIYPFFKERTEKTQQYITKTYVLTKSKLIKIMINSLLKLQKLYRPVIIIKSWDEIIN